MKINLNGSIIDDGSYGSLHQNRAFNYGDGLFDTLKYHRGEIQFPEEHYFRLMSSMRMLRMKIPDGFTLEAYQEQIEKTLKSNQIKKSARIRVNFFRTNGGLYNPLSNRSEFLIEVAELPSASNSEIEIELFKDFHVSSGLLSTIKTNNRLTNVLASVFATENDFQNAVLINEKKELVSATDANLFLVKDGRLITPSLESGCINGIIRKKIIEAVRKSSELEIDETSISPFELLKADEVFLTNSVAWVRSVSRYRKRTFGHAFTRTIEELLTDFVS